MYKNTSLPSTQVVVKFYGTYLNDLRIWIFNFLPKFMKQYLKCSHFNIGLFAEPENIDSLKEETLEIYFNSLILKMSKRLIKHLRMNSIFKTESLVNIDFLKKILFIYL